jgi:hypothetical protein
MSPLILIPALTGQLNAPAASSPEITSLPTEQKAGWVLDMVCAFFEKRIPSPSRDSNPESSSPYFAVTAVSVFSRIFQTFLLFR